MKRNLYENKVECCGCEACANTCPVSIIEMKPDGEGFLYPSITDESKCINCHKCENVCPIKQIAVVENFQEKAFAGYADTDDEIKTCASGGLATAISRSFIKNGGVVYGVQYGVGCEEVYFSRATSEDELERFKTSKYVQAHKYNVYGNVLKDLKSMRRVLFIGLPCECYALQLFLGKSYENLYVCSLICHGPTSQAVHVQYCKKIKSEYPGEIAEFSVRYKKDGWKPYYIRAKFKEGYEYLEKFAEATYGIAFLYLKRPSCNVCQIKRNKIHSDITIGDYHLAFGGQVMPYNFNGVSSCIIHTNKGKELLLKLNAFHLEKVTVKSVLYSEAYYKAIPARKNRAEFGRTFSDFGLDAACELKSISKIEKEIAFKHRLLRTGAALKKLLLRPTKMLKICCK